MIDLAIKKNSLIGGDDFKSGQTKMKSVLVDFLVGAGIKVLRKEQSLARLIFINILIQVMNISDRFHYLIYVVVY